MISQPFTEIKHVGTRRIGRPQQFDLWADELGLACAMYAESHVAEPEAQFVDLVVRNPHTIPMNTGSVDPYLSATPYEPLRFKRLCQGVGGHLGEGAAALSMYRNLGLMDRLAHIALRGGRVRCPDFVVVVSLGHLFTAFGVTPRAWESHVGLLPIPLEAKSRADATSNLKTFLAAGAIQQIICYWWVMLTRSQCSNVVGYGIATAFCHQHDQLLVSLLRPRDQMCYHDLIDLLHACASTRDLYALLDNGLDTVFALLEGF